MQDKQGAVDNFLIYGSARHYPDIAAATCHQFGTRSLYYSPTNDRTTLSASLFLESGAPSTAQTSRQPPVTILMGCIGKDFPMYRTYLELKLISFLAAKVSPLRPWRQPRKVMGLEMLFGSIPTPILTTTCSSIGECFDLLTGH